MMSVLRFGSQQSLELELPPNVLKARCDAPRGEPLADVAAAVDRALAEPLEFPPLRQAALPLDKVAMALEPGVPQAATIVERTIRQLLANGIEAEDITVVHTLAKVGEATPELLVGLPREIRQAITLAVHDPHNRKELSYLAAATDAKPIYINRALHDADFVISIGSLRVAESLGYHGINSCIFPTFSDAASQSRYQSPKAADHARLVKQADEVAWLLGLSFTIQVVPGPGGEALQVLAGEWKAVKQAGSKLAEQAWSFELPERADLVIATIEGAEYQTWENVGRALAAAAGVVSPDGGVALCTDLAEPPGPGLQQVIGADDLAEVLEELVKHPTSDALAARELVRALQRGRVYLISRLDEDVVEELGASPLAADQLSRIASQYQSCIVLSNAHEAMARIGDSGLEPRKSARSKSRK